jgi:hypothetical protein
MANRRMFSKSITNSSKFLKMPVSSRLLYYDLGMNADDDGFVEHFMVLRMTGATQQDLGVLELNGLVKVFDDNVLWIKDWKENNYIRNDRYQPSKYIAMYNLDTIGIPEVSTGKDRLELGKDNIKENTKRKFTKPTIEEIQNYCNERNNGINAEAFYDFYESKDWYVGKNKMKDWKACVRTWEKRNTKVEAKPEWFNQDIKTKTASDEDINEINKLLDEI